jgi:SPP1 family predicted phage head-tail adaptor
MSPVPSVGSGARRQLVTLENQSVVGLDGDGGYTTTWAPLTPPTLFAAMTTEVQTERAQSGTVVATATYTVRMPYHPQVTMQTRLTFNGRILQVISRKNVDERNIELELVCTEVVP